MTLAYLATPYSKYERGIDAAYVDACKLAARLICSGVNCYSPIVHAHGIAVHGAIDPLDQKFWNDVDAVILAKCDTLVVAHMDGWEESSGIAHEIEQFQEAGKPIFDLDPVSLRMVRRSKDSTDSPKMVECVANKMALINQTSIGLTFSDLMREMAKAAIEEMRKIPNVAYDDYRCDKPWRELNSREVLNLWIDAALTPTAQP